LTPVQLFIPARTRKEAEQDAPNWACRFTRVTGGFIAFDSDGAFQDWKRSHIERKGNHPSVDSSARH
jgi:hypothetical protein